MSPTLVVLMLVSLPVFTTASLCTASKGMPEFYVPPKSKVERLSAASFNSKVLNAHDDTTWLVEFYADWCPHCQHFQPEFEKIGVEVTSWNSNVHVGAVSCVCEPTVCANMKIEGYPTTKVFTAKKKNSGTPAHPYTGVETPAWTLKVADLKQYITSHHRTRGTVSATTGAAHTSAFIDYRTKFAQTAKKADVQHDILASISFNLQHEVMLGVTSLTGNKLDALRKWLQFLARYLPYPNARGSLTTLLAALKEKSSFSVGEYERAVGHALFDHAPGARPVFQKTPTWKVCVLSRGYTCGLWMGFHALMVQQPDRAGNRPLLDAVHALRNFIRNFFACDECRTHFLALTEVEAELRPTSTKDLAHLTKGELTKDMSPALWLWARHNQVNIRLGREEIAQRRVNPHFVKRIVPDLNECPLCFTRTRRDENQFKIGEFDLLQVQSFLKTVYCPAHPRMSVKHSICLGDGKDVVVVNGRRSLRGVNPPM